MRTYELKVKGKKVSSRNPDIRTAVCSNKWESTALATLRDIIIQIVESIYTKIFITSSYILLRIQSYFTWSMLKNKSLQEANEQKP